MRDTDRQMFRAERYAKQILFHGIGKEGQEKIAKSRVTVIGLGALGTVIASNLCRAGVGHLKIVDRDFVELSNLQRQILFDEEDASRRMPKAVAAAEKLCTINSGIEIEPLIADVNAENVEEIIEDSSLVLDGTDNLETRFLLNDACVKNDLPWIYGAALGARGNVMTIVPAKTPCLRCLMEEAPAPGSMPTCDTEGVLAALTGVVASVECAEALKLIVGREPSLALLCLDVWQRDFRDVLVERREDCPACGRGDYVYLSGEHTSWTTTLCGRDAVQIVPPVEQEISLETLKRRLSRIGSVSYNGFLLSFERLGKELVVFPTGRTIIRGTTDETEARRLYARYVGV